MIYIHIIITICVAILAAFITHLFALRRESKNWKQTLELQKIQEYNKGAAIFRSAFSPALRTLEQVLEKNTYQTLTKDIHAHEIAMIQFKPYLSDKEQGKLINVWRKYIYSKPDSPDRINMNEYSASKTTINNLQSKPVEIIEKELRELAKHHIKKLLECAKPK